MTKKALKGAFVFAFWGMLVLGQAAVMAAPPAKNVKEVVDYYYNGQDQGPILTDAKLCKGIKALECEAAVDPKAVMQGDVLHVWMQFFVPKGAMYDDIIVEYKHGGVPRHLNARRIEGSIRYRVMDKFKPDKPGQWTVTIKKGVANLKAFNITVIEK
ncbi:MAG: hypothetical protein JRF72_03940 [Deltaproteobacteria bacterium]|jgi:hypothetical protein|nr:hypothetical protein [Deltaproteobacteria bacterium]